MAAGARPRLPLLALCALLLAGAAQAAGDTDTAMVPASAEAAAAVAGGGAAAVRSGVYAPGSLLTAAAAAARATSAAAAGDGAPTQAVASASDELGGDDTLAVHSLLPPPQSAAVLRFRALFNPRPVPNYAAGVNGCGSKNSGGGVTGWFSDKVPDGSWESACDWHDGCYAAHLPKAYCDEGLKNGVTALARDGEYWFPGTRGAAYELAVEKMGDGPYAASFTEAQRQACTAFGKVDTDCLSRNAAVNIDSFPKAPTQGLSPAQHEQIKNLPTPKADEFERRCMVRRQRRRRAVQKRICKGELEGGRASVSRAGPRKRARHNRPRREDGDRAREATRER